MESSLKEAEKEGVKVPQTVEEYTAAFQKQLSKTLPSAEYDDMLDYDDYVESSDEDEEDDERISEEHDYGVDSGTA